jgi:hypothetical protein
MHVETGESGALHMALARGVLASLLACAFASCGNLRQPRASIVSPLSGQEPEKPQEPVAPPPTQNPPQKTLEEWQEELRKAREEEQGKVPEPQNEPAEPTEQAEAPSTEIAAESATVAAESALPPPQWVHGSLAVRYRGRTNGDDTDHEISNVLTLDVADPKSPGGVSGHLLARMDVDAEGKDDGEVFGDLSDTYDSDVISKVYLAFADIPVDGQSKESPGLLRVGRQQDPSLPEVLRLDGVSYLTPPLGKNEVEVGAYGGIPVHLYESSSEGDSAFGTFVEGNPWQGGRARVDWMHLEDEEVLGEGQDDLLALGLWHDLPEHWRFEGEYTHLEGDPRDLRLRALYDDGKGETIVRAEYFELLETQKAHVTELDPFYEQMLEYFPYRQATLNVSQVLGPRTVVDVGFNLRRVSESDDVGEFNRDWERYYATATWSDLWTDGLALSVTVDRWDDEDRDTSTLGADLSYEASENWNASIGSYYSLYKYQLLELDEREDVRTYYVRASREVSESFDITCMYELENDDIDTYHTLRVGGLWRF